MYLYCTLQYLRSMYECIVLYRLSPIAHVFILNSVIKADAAFLLHM